MLRLNKEQLTPGRESARKDRRRALGLAGAFAAMGTLHLVAPKPFEALIPRELPGSRRGWAYGSGIAELGCAALVAIPRTRRFGGLATALLMLGVFPGNVKMAVDANKKALPARAAAYARLPLQYPMITLALRVRESA